MKDISDEFEVIALGKEIFTDLWRLFGFRSVICENPNDVYLIWKELM
ncbi:MAG: cell division protein, partial [Acetomicrobium sp.]|nr:cell division protein [Acetomicrobium sp.]